jgi:hypothetical protein
MNSTPTTNASDRRLTVLKAGASGNPAAAERGGCDLADVGAPSVAAYVDRWRKRASWKKAFFTTSEYGAHHLMAMTTMMMMAADALDGAFYLTLVPIRPRRRGERRSLRSFSPGVSLRPHHPFNPRPRRLSTPLLTPLNSTPTSLCRREKSVRRARAPAAFGRGLQL